MCSSLLIQGDRHKAMTSPGFLCIIGSHTQQKRGLLIINEWTLDRTNSFLFLEWGIVVSEGAQQHLTWQEPFTGCGRQVGSVCHFSGILWGCKRRGCHFGNSSSTARNTCRLILANKRFLCMAEVLYLVRVSTSHTWVQSLSVQHQESPCACAGHTLKTVFGLVPMVRLPLIHLLSA